MKQIISNQPFKLVNAHLYYTAVLKQMPKMAGNEQVVEFHSPWAEHQTLSIYSVSLGWFWPHKIWLFKHVAPPSTYQNDPERAQTGPKISHHQGTLTQAPSRVEMVEPESHSMEMVEFSSYKKPMISHGMGMVWAPSWSRTMVQSPVFETNPDVPNISSKNILCLGYWR